MRSILLTLACALPLAVTAVGAPVSSDAMLNVAQLAEPAARRGTRNYRPGEEATTPADTASDKDSLSRAEKLSQCMETWDTGTHITKSKWREICVRQLNEQ